MNKKYILGGVLVIIIASAVWFFRIDFIASFTKNPFSVVATDSISSWDFKGAYTGNQELEQRAFSEISRIKGIFRQFKKADYPNYQLYVSIANQYDLLGDGGNEYKFLGLALSEDSTSTGLAWVNMGNLMEKLGAYESAKIAYQKAVEAQRAQFYVDTLNDFLTTHFPDEIK